MTRRLAIAWLILLAAATTARAGPGAEAERPPVDSTAVRTIFVLRHTEKAKEPADDPPLAPEGEARAHTLARMVGVCPIDGLFATDTRRAMATLAPLAEKFGLEIETIPIDDPYGSAHAVLQSGHRFMVVAAHGDTVIPILEGLGAWLDPRPEGIEYDDLFIVTVDPPKKAKVIHLKYGEPAP
jgi:hypothetical protein